MDDGVAVLAGGVPSVGLVVLVPRSDKPGCYRLYIPEDVPDEYPDYQVGGDYSTMRDYYRGARARAIAYWTAKRRADA